MIELEDEGLVAVPIGDGFGIITKDAFVRLGKDCVLGPNDFALIYDGGGIRINNSEISPLKKEQLDFAISYARERL